MVLEYVPTFTPFFWPSKYGHCKYSMEIHGMLCAGSSLVLSSERSEIFAISSCSNLVPDRRLGKIMINQQSIGINQDDMGIWLVVEPYPSEKSWS